MSKNESVVQHGSISWLTLFYDLIIVAVFARATYIYGKNPTWLTLGFIGVALLSLFVIWSLTTLELLLSKRETWARRALVFVQVCALLVSGLAMYRGGGISDRWGFIALTASFLSIAALVQLRRRDSRREAGIDNRYTRSLTVLALITAGIYGVGACFPMGFSINGFLIAWAFYGIGTIFATIAFGMVAPRLMLKPAIFSAHELNERFGVLLLIALGDAFLQLIEVLGTMRSIPQPQFLVFTLTFVVSVWLLYYPTLSTPELPQNLVQARSRIAAHFLLVVSGALGIVAYVELSTGFGDSGHANNWSSLPVLGLVGAILWLTLLQYGRWTKQATVLFLSVVVLLVLTVLTDVADSLVQELDLVLANIVVLVTAIVVLGLSGKFRTSPAKNP